MAIPQNMSIPLARLKWMKRLGYRAEIALERKDVDKAAELVRKINDLLYDAPRPLKDNGGN